MSLSLRSFEGKHILGEYIGFRTTDGHGERYFLLCKAILKWREHGRSCHGPNTKGVRSNLETKNVSPKRSQERRIFIVFFSILAPQLEGIAVLNLHLTTASGGRAFLLELTAALFAGGQAVPARLAEQSEKRFFVFYSCYCHQQLY